MRIVLTPFASFALAAALTALPGRVSAAPSAPAAVQDRAVQAKASADLAALREEVRKAELALAPLYARRHQLDTDASRIATEIDALKGKPAGVRRDLDLQTLLGASKSKTDELERVQRELRWREPGMAELRRRVVRLIDQVLDHEGAANTLPEATRLELERYRTQTVALLVSPATPLQIVRERDAANMADPLDGPRELRSKADLLRDSGDKLRREARRIAGRIDNVERRRRLRERAGALDEDMFGEISSNRRVARVAAAGPAATATNRGTEATADSAGSPGVQGPVGAPPSPGASLGVPPSGGGFATRSDSTVLRNLVDPATLDELRRADSIDDVERQTRALKKAQVELESLATELDKRAKALEGLADELKKRK